MAGTDCGTFQDAKLGTLRMLIDGMGLNATPWDPSEGGVTVPFFDLLTFEGGDMYCTLS